MKNPWMSAWLSAANKVAGTARGQMLAEARRQQKAMATEAARSLTGTAPKKRAPSRRTKG